MRAFMVSADKDLGQLISSHCSLLKPGKKGNEFETLDSTAFCEEWGISTPMQIIDILALMGDASDNIPGVPGVGAVTARKLIAQFGSVENLLARTAEIKGKLREKIEQNADSARLSYDLATIRRDAPLPCTLEECERREINRAALRTLFDKLEFRGLIKRLKLLDTDSPPDPPQQAADEDDLLQPDLFSTPQLSDIGTIPHTYHTLTTAQQRRALAEQLAAAPRWAFDTETTGLDPLKDRLIGISFCITPHEAYYASIATPQDVQDFATAFASEALKVGLNLKFDLSVLRHAGMQVRGPFFDAMLAHSALYPQLRHNMDDMAATLLGYRTIRLEEIAGENCDTSSVPLSKIAEYGAEDADVTLRLADVLASDLAQHGLTELMERVEFPLIPVLADIELEGMRLEPSLLQQSADEMAARISDICLRVDSIVGRPINLNSPQQVGDLLFNDMKLLAKPKKTRTGQYVTDEETLRRLEPLSPIVGDILEFRELSKLKSTYIDALPRFISPVDGRIHSNLLQMVTATGRLASQSPCALTPADSSGELLWLAARGGASSLPITRRWNCALWQLSPVIRRSSPPSPTDETSMLKLQPAFTACHERK